jgi:hypothetical protein
MESVGFFSFSHQKDFPLLRPERSDRSPRVSAVLPRQESRLEGQISLHDLPRSRGSVMGMNFVGFLSGLFDEKPFPTKQTAKQSLVAAMRQNDIANAASSGEQNFVWSCGHSSLKRSANWMPDPFSGVRSAEST